MGYQTAAKVCEDGLFLSLAIKHKVINRRTCLEMIKRISESTSGADFRRKVSEMFNNKTAQANYGKYSFYRISNVNFDKTVVNTTIRKLNRN